MKNLFKISSLLILGNLVLSNECIQGDCVNGQGIFRWSDEREYTGEWKNGLRHGYGPYIDSNGEVLFEGQWEHDGFLE